MRRVQCDGAGAEEAALAVLSGGVAVYPTDTVYGIGCDPYDARAVSRVRRIKSREHSKPFPILARSASDAGDIAKLGDAAAKLAAAFWPGGLTMILELSDASLRSPMGLAGTVAVRVPGGSCVSRILRECGYLVGTSANASGGEPARLPPEMDCDILVDGGRTPGGESTIVDARGPAAGLVREGVIPFGEVSAEL